MASDRWGQRSTLSRGSSAGTYLVTGACTPDVGVLGCVCVCVCVSGIPFMRVEASDRDDRNTAHAELRFLLMDQTPRIPAAHMFAIDSVQGEVSLTEDG